MNGSIFAYYSSGSTLDFLSVRTKPLMYTERFEIELTVVDITSCIEGRVLGMCVCVSKSPPHSKCRSLPN